MKVLILYNRIFPYRIPIWNLLSLKCDLTVTYSEGNISQETECRFNTKFLPYINIGPFVWHTDNIFKLAKNFDVVIVYGDIKWLKFVMLPFFCKKVIFWTIGVSTKKGYNIDKRKNRFFHFFYKRAKALVFYSNDPIEEYVKNGFRRECLFVANNTVEVVPLVNNVAKDNIVFIGTLHKRKGLNLLLEAYFSLIKDYNLPKLIIVGDGPEYEAINKWIVQNSMTDNIITYGRVTKIEEKAQILSRAIACISPKQAGLSVLECMGYGVPFVTTKDAITGGERFNIHNNIDGIVMDDESQIADVLIDISENPVRFIEMGKKAYQFYIENRTPQQMVEGLWRAISYTNNQV